MTRTEALYKELGLWPVWVEKSFSCAEPLRTEKKFLTWACGDLMFVVDFEEVSEAGERLLKNLLQSFLGQDRECSSLSDWHQVSGAAALAILYTNQIKRCFCMGEESQFQPSDGIIFYRCPPLSEVLKNPKLKIQLWTGWLFLSGFENAAINTP